MEDKGLVDADNDIDLFCLQRVFLPRIQNHLNTFWIGWYNHRLRTEHNKTPHQLWVQGISELADGNPDHLVIDGLRNNEVNFVNMQKL